MKVNDLICIYRGHKSAVNAVAYASGGEFIVSGSADAEIAIWEGTLNDKRLRQFGGHGGAVLSLRVFEDKIFSISEDRTIRIWELSTGHALKSILNCHTGPMNAIALTLDGNRIVSASDDGSVRIFDSETGEPCMLPLRMSERTFAVAVSHDGAMVACNNADNCVHIWRGNMAQRAVWPDDFIRRARGLEFCPIDEQGFLSYFDLSSDGWVYGPTNERMYWIPPVYWAGLWTPRTVRILGALETMIDLRNFVHGTDWEQCRAQVSADKT
jgi:WD40 repeat protein